MKTWLFQSDVGLRHRLTRAGTRTVHHRWLTQSLSFVESRNAHSEANPFATALQEKSGHW
jgi:hypothetical protein